MSGTADSWEISIVARIAAGDDLALALAFERLGPVVHGIAQRLVGPVQAADVSQEVFLTLWDHPERFDPTRGSLRALLVTIARRRCFDHLRGRGRREATELRAASRAAVPVDVESTALAHLRGRDVRRALAALPDAQRRAIELAYFDGLTFREVAVVTEVSEGTAKSRIRLGLQRLAALLDEHEEVRP